MQQRNDTAETLIVATDPVTVVEPGEVVDLDVHVAGLTAVDPEPPAQKPPAADAPTPKHADEAKTTDAKEASK